jgi:signal transduction histidine kinase
MDLPSEAFIRNNPETESSIRANERRRISRELHNSTSQLTTALQLLIGHLRRQDLPTAIPITAKMDQVVQEIVQSIKQIATQQSQDGHDCGELNEEIAKRFYALGDLESVKGAK